MVTGSAPTPGAGAGDRRTSASCTQLAPRGMALLPALFLHLQEGRPAGHCTSWTVTEGQVRAADPDKCRGSRLVGK